MKKILAYLFLCLLMASCKDKVWQRTDEGIIVRIKDLSGKRPGLVAINVVNENILHIRSVPGRRLSNDTSLFVTAEPDSVEFTVKEIGNYLEIATSELQVSLSVMNGTIIFRDKKGSVLLEEPAEGGKMFRQISVEDTKGYTLRQVFSSPDNEAFYGLGQHQSEEFNYKGLNESLYQYNTKVSVPFIISSKNYGLLWDNYSLTKFGDPRDYSQLSLFNLYDEEGEPGALTAKYKSSSGNGEILIARREQTIDYENLETVKGFPEKFPLYGSTITWTGGIEPKESGEYQFRLYYAGYVKFYINDKLVVPERWRTAWNPNTYKFFIDLEKGKKYPLRLEWKPDGGISYIGLKALSPLNDKEKGQLSFESEMGDQIDYYFIRGENKDDVISGYRTLTGKAPIMPKWALGFWQSRERYKSQKELLEVVSEYRKRKIPIDNIVLDWSYWPVDAWGSHEFDPQFFPDPAGMVEQVHNMNARIMVSVWPKFYYTTGHYKEFDSKGWMYRQAVNDSVRDWIGKGYIGSFYDAYSPEARELFWNQIREHLFTKGFDAWWMDASEPDILSNASVDYRKKLMTPTALGPSVKYFNAYSLMNAMAIYNGQRSADPDRRVFLLTRSGFPGLQAYSTATWSGDIGTRWEDMRSQIPAGLNYSLSGIPYWTFDIGGFCVENRYANAKSGSEDLEEWRELNTRWFQFGSFCPLFRSHGQYPYREIFNISNEGHPAYKSMIYYDKLRYFLMPYIYSLAGCTYFNDYTIMRAMVMDFPDDKSVENIGDQYLFGPSLLVAPVYEYKARKRDVYLPGPNGWYDIYSGKYYSGGVKITAVAPYERIPVMVREGSIIPVGPEIQFTSEKPADPVTLWIYRGRNCTFTLYEDEGINYNYEKGACTTIRLSLDEVKGELTIGRRNGSFEGMLKSRKFGIIIADGDNNVAFDPLRRPDISVDYDGNELIVKLNN